MTFLQYKLKKTATWRHGIAALSSWLPDAVRPYDDMYTVLNGVKHVGILSILKLLMQHLRHRVIS